MRNKKPSRLSCKTTKSKGYLFLNPRRWISNQLESLFSPSVLTWKPRFFK
ncbi:hypothetical protein Hanom_Chr14g01295491 [Helianthus anomalus]